MGELLKAKDENHALALENGKIALLEAENGKKDELLQDAVKTAQKAHMELTEAYRTVDVLVNGTWSERRALRKKLKK